jgi:hypothetical protein
MKHIHKLHACRMKRFNDLPYAVLIQECKPQWHTVHQHIMLPCDIEQVNLDIPLKPMFNT